MLYLCFVVVQCNTVFTGVSPVALINISNLSHAPLIGGWRLFKNLDATKKYFLLFSQHIFCLYEANAENRLLTWVTIKR